MANDMVEAYLYVIVGVACLYYGADFLVHGSASLALRLGIPSLVVGLIIVGYATGTPELIVSLEASFAGRGDIAIGNVIGSNLANTGLVLGFSALCRPLIVDERLIRFDGWIMVLVSFLICAILQTGLVTRFQGVMLIFLLLLYSGWVVYYAWKEKDSLERHAEEELSEKLTRNIWTDFFYIISGVVILYYGGHFFLKGSISFAQKFGVSDAVIGLTLVALGTSLPELATAIVAVLRRHGDIALGNIIGSNIFNILAIIGITSSIDPITLSGIHWVDYGMMTLIAMVMLGMMYTNRNISRIEGGVLLFTYLGYLTYLVIR